MNRSSKIAKDPVGTMIGFYLLAGPPGDSSHTIYYEGRPWKETSFVPMNASERFSADGIYSRL